MNPLASAQRLRRWKPGTEPADFLGTGFMYRWCNRVVTARHCIEGVPQDEIAVEAGFAVGFVQSVRAIHRHPTADIAVLESGGLQMADAPSKPFHQVGPATALGVDFMAYGFPVGMDGGLPNVPAPRLLKGHFQRYDAAYISFEGYKYRAGETSIPLPAGMSGGPIFNSQDHATVIAMGTGSVESERLLHASEEVFVDGGPTVRREFRTVVTYGMALMLADVATWLDEICPPRASYEPPASLVADATDQSPPGLASSLPTAP